MPKATNGMYCGRMHGGDVQRSYYGFIGALFSNFFFLHKRVLEPIGEGSVYIKFLNHEKMAPQQKYLLMHQSLGNSTPMPYDVASSTATTTTTSSYDAGTGSF